MTASGRGGRVAAVVAASATVACLLASCGVATSGADNAPVEDQTTTTAAPTTTSPPVVARRVLTLGDSAMVDAEQAIIPAFAAAGAEVAVPAAASGFGLTGMTVIRTPSPWPEEWPRLVEQIDPDLTIVMMGGWDGAFIAENGIEAYRQVAARAAAVLTAKGGKVLWLSMLPDTVEKPDPEPATEAYAGLPALFPGQVFFADVAPALRGPAGDFPRSFVDEDGQLLLTRKVDGWHLCQDGAVRIAEFVNRTAVDLGLAAPAPDGTWERGPWWDDQAFDGNPACWPPGAWQGAGPDRTPPAAPAFGAAAVPD